MVKSAVVANGVIRRNVPVTALALEAERQAHLSEFGIFADVATLTMKHGRSREVV
jgi:hypothetical protein